MVAGPGGAEASAYKWVTLVWVLTFLTHPTLSLISLFPDAQSYEELQSISNCTLHSHELHNGLYHLKEQVKFKLSSLKFLLFDSLSQQLEKYHGGLWCCIVASP